MVPDFSSFGYACLPAKAFPSPEMMKYNTLLIKTDKAASASATATLEDEINSALNGKYSVFLERKDHLSVSMFENEIRQHKMMGDIFPVAFLLIALLTMATTMTRIVANQRTQIGTLRALGFKKSVIMRHYISYGFFLALLGAATGLAAGPLSLPYLFYPSMSGFYTMPEWKPAYDPSFLWISAALVLLCAAVCRLVCGGILRENPSDTLRPKAPKIFRHGFIERTRLWGKLGANAKWNIRDASRNRARSLMAVIGVFGCTSLVVCALSMNDSIEDLKSWQYETVNRYESKFILDENATPEQTDEIKKAVNGEALMEREVEIKANGRKKSVSLLIRDNNDLIRPTGIDLRPANLPANGISVTLKTAEALGLKRGDTFEWQIYGGGNESKKNGEVAEIYRNPANQGITMSREHFESQGLKFRPTAIITAEKTSRNYEGVDSVISTADSKAGWDELTEAMYIMVYLLITAAAVLSIVVLYNLGLLSFTEMTRELATLKVMGFKSGMLRELLLTQNLWFSAIGFALGVPGGLKLCNIIVSFSGDEFDFPVSLHLPTLLISFAFTFGLSIFVNLLFSKKIRRLNMVESLKL
jgi:putative ABC transport system permease protein